MEDGIRYRKGAEVDMIGAYMLGRKKLVMEANGQCIAAQWLSVTEAAGSVAILAQKCGHEASGVGLHTSVLMRHRHGSPQSPHSWGSTCGIKLCWGYAGRATQGWGSLRAYPGMQVCSTMSMTDCARLGLPIC
eukprot:3786493-Amphidinium_carterae.1